MFFERRRNRGIVSVALMSPEMNSEFKQRRAALAVNNADVLLHLGTCLADYVPVLRLVGRALLRAENGDASSAEDTLDQATQMIHEIHRKRIADQTGHDVIPSASGDTHSGYDSR